MSSDKSYGLSFLTSIVVFLLGLTGVIYSSYKWSHVSNSSDWDTVQGTLVSCKVESYKVSKKTWENTWYYPVIKYTYILNNELHQGNTIQLDFHEHLTEDEAYELVEKERWLESNILTVYINPENNREVALIVGKGSVSNGTYLVLVICAMMLLSGFIGLVRNVKDFLSF